MPEYSPELIESQWKLATNMGKQHFYKMEHSYVRKKVKNLLIEEKASIMAWNKLALTNQSITVK